MKSALPVPAVLIAAAVLSAQPAPAIPETQADDLGELTADRPGFGVTTNVLPRGVTHLESGFTFTSEAGPGISHRTLTWGSPLARVGIGRRTEIRFGGDGFLTDRTVAGGYAHRAQGWSDFGWGAKIALYGGHDLWPAVSVIPTLSLPIGARTFTSAAVDPNLTLAWSTNLPAKFNAGGTIGFASLSDEAGRFAQRTQALSVGRALFSGLSGYAEAYNVSPAARAADATWIFNGGLTHALGRNAQIDLEGGRQLLSASRSWFVSGGLVVRTAGLGHVLSRLK
jgi:hypothetical protein